MLSFQSHRPASLIGLHLDGRNLDGVLIHRSNGSYRISQTFSIPLTLDPLTNDPELVGREIRNHLDQAGIRERYCTVCLPSNWVLTLACKVPDIPEADVPGFLQLEAEQGFPYDPADLSISTSRYRLPNGAQHASLLAVPQHHLVLLTKTLRAARLKPISLSLGITALEPYTPDPAPSQLSLGVGQTGIDMLVSAPGGIAALRSIEGVIEKDGAGHQPDFDLLAREIRITLGQLPRELRDTIRQVVVYGGSPAAESLIEHIRPIARSLGMSVESGAAPRVNGSEFPQLARTSTASALGLAARHIQGQPCPFEFLPPRVSPWTQFVHRFASRRIAYTGAAAAAVLLLLGSAFLVQQWRLSSLENRWKSMQPRVRLVEGLQTKTRAYRPWFDESALTLRILLRVVQAFPEDGAVSAKNVQIKNGNEVICAGQARDNQALLQLLDSLSAFPQVADLKTQQVRGKSPLQYILTFRWIEGGRHED